MNWYRQIKLTQDYLEQKPGQNYLDIGHDEEECESHLWLWGDNRIYSKQVEPVTGKNFMSEEAVNMHADWDLYHIFNPEYLGRIERCEGKVPKGSIGVVNGRREIPSIVTRSLYNKFGQDLELYRF